jgi:hypothetical protein
MPLPEVPVPHYELTVPSTGKKLRYRPFLVKEEKIMLMAAESNDSESAINAMKDMIYNCTDGVMGKEPAPFFDLEYIFLQIRGKSVGEKVELIATCKEKDTSGAECNGQRKFVIDISKVQVQKDPSHTNKIDLGNGYGIVMKYPSWDWFERQSKMEQSPSKVQEAFNQIVNCIDYTYGPMGEICQSKDCTPEQLSNFIEGLTKENFEKINHFFATMPHILHEERYKCEKCGFEHVLRLETVEDFFG